MGETFRYLILKRIISNEPLNLNSLILSVEEIFALFCCQRLILIFYPTNSSSFFETALNNYSPSPAPYYINGKSKSSDSTESSVWIKKKKKSILFIRCSYDTEINGWCCYTTSHLQNLIIYKCHLFFVSFCPFNMIH